MKILLLLNLYTLFPNTGYTNMNQMEAHKPSMENDAQFIEAVGLLFNGLANLQRTITQGKL